MLRILIIDDVETNRFVLRNIITDNVHSVGVIAGGKYRLNRPFHKRL